MSKERMGYGVVINLLYTKYAKCCGSRWRISSHVFAREEVDVISRGGVTPKSIGWNFTI